MRRNVLARIPGAAKRLDARLSRHSLPLGAALALLLSAALAALNIVSGPLFNLNDIGGWQNRVLFIGMTAAVHFAALLAAALLYRESFTRLALRQLLLTAGLYILLMGINQKTYAYVNTMQPLVRVMDTQGLAAIPGFETNLSAPALTLLYLVTRGPVYDMYLVKLLCIGCMLLIALLVTHAADRAGLGMRAETLLALCLILPHGFMNAACSAQLDIVAVALLGVALFLVLGVDRPRPAAGAVCFGVAAAVSGAALYALPVLVWLTAKGKMKPAHLAGSLLVMAALCVPAMAAGMPALSALFSLLRANFGVPGYAAGAPNVMSLFPRAVLEEIPQYAALRHLPELDAVTNAQPYYTQEHFTLVMRGLTLAGLAAYAGLCAFVRGDRRMDGTAKALALTLGALLICPGVTSSAWLAADALCVYALLARPGLRLPACVVLFATAGASCYPMTEETLLPMAAAFVLCLLALCMVLRIIPTGRGGSSRE